MSHRKVGGRLLPCEPGSTQYEEDEYRGQRRRPWMCFRVGRITQEITTEHFVNFMKKVHQTMIEKGVLLDGETEHLKYAIIGTDYEFWRRELRDGLEQSKHKYEKGPLSCPIVITFLDQYDQQQVDRIIEDFSVDMHFVKLDQQEVLEMLQQAEFQDLEFMCSEFVGYLQEQEGLPETIATKRDIEERPVRFGSGFVPGSSLKNYSNSLEYRRNSRKPIPRNMEKVGGSCEFSLGEELQFSIKDKEAPPGLTPPGLPNTHQKSFASNRNVSLAPPPGLEVEKSQHVEHNPGNRSGYVAENRSISVPPGIAVARPPGIQSPVSRIVHDTVQNYSENLRSFQYSTADQEEENRDSDILSYKDVMFALQLVKDRENERGVPNANNNNNMVMFIDTPKMHRRLEMPFGSLAHNLDLLAVLNFAVGTVTKECFTQCRNVLQDVFNYGFPMKLKTMFLDRHFAEGVWSEKSTDLLFEVFLLFFYTARFKKRLIVGIESFLPAWEDISDAFDHTDERSLSSARVTQTELKNLRKLIAQVEKWIQKSRMGDHLERPYTSCDQREEQSFRNERMLPSEDFHHHYRDDVTHHRESRAVPETRTESDRHRYSHENYQDDPRQYRSRQYSYDMDRDEVDLASRNGSRREKELSYADHESDIPLGFRRESGTADGRTVDPLTEKSVDEVEETIIEELNRTVINTDEKKKQTYKYIQNEYKDEPLWKKFEAVDPPDDFRTLSTIPTLKDYTNHETEPFLRRIKENGVYNSSAHYLDIQFRLLREDLVSSLRDGLELYRTTGTCKGRRIEGIECSDISIHTIDSVEEKQVTEKDGSEMRIAWPAQQEISNLIENEKEAREQGLAILSCDRFVEDFHLVIIQSSLLTTKGCLHLVILDDSQPFKPNTSYLMAQGQSYLPSYQFVLDNLKNINPFKPLPFERYLVHGKKEIFRPAFHDFTKSEEQQTEEKRLEKIYNEIRSVAVSQRYMKGKPVPGGIDEDDDADFCYKPNAKKPVENDREYEQLKEPIFEHRLSAPTAGNDTIFIDDKIYHVSRMLNDFHPDYLDESQRVAFCHTFKSEISLIQGPPGTGKTHIGVQILKTMLQNRTTWKMTGPILIVCYSNNGLDNFLERVWQVIENDESLSKDNGRPRMVRYGKKCESEFLKRKKVMRQDVNEIYRSRLPENVVREQTKTATNKRKKAEDLSLASGILFSSRTDIISFDVLSRVMLPSYQDEVRQFAATHVDTNDRLLSNDEALACWLLDKDFGTSSKAQSKKNKKFQASGDSDDEIPIVPTEDTTDEEDDGELNEEEKWDRLLKKQNLKCSGNDVLGAADEEEVTEYYTKKPWEIMQDYQLQLVVLMGKKVKHGVPVDERIASILKEVRTMILSTAPLKSEDLSDIKYIFSLERPKRWALYQTWCRALRKLISENLPNQIRDYRLACQKAQNAYDKLDAEVMKISMVVGCTTTGCARLRPVLEQVKPRILIVEEAAQVLEGHIVSAMISSIEQVVMIGDHKQLRPNMAVNGLHDFGLDISMFERLVERGLPFVQLREQHRMNTNISELIVRPAFYSNVHDAENVFSYPAVEGMASNLFFWAHRSREETPDGVSWINRREIEMTVALVKHFLKQSYTHKDIVVLATYSAQRNLMYYEYNSVFGPSDSRLVPVETVDSYQGRESKIVIVSLVRSHRGIDEHTGIGFLAVANRICVALTRAQHGMYIVGNGAYIMSHSQLWKKIGDKLNGKYLINYEVPLKCSAHGKITEIEDPKEFSVKAPEGGCDQICNITKVCGHVCDRKCHPQIEEEHMKPCEMRCMKPCSNPTFNHHCMKRCYEECGSCVTLVEIDLDCGHRITTPCHRIRQARCDQKCGKDLSCGHRCANDCGAPCTNICQKIVHTELKCGHMKEVACGLLKLGNFDPKCVERCENRMLTCDHQCAEKCGDSCTVMCQEEIDVELGCNHTQKVICSDIGRDKKTDHVQCETLVSMKLEPCNHLEKVICGSDASSKHCTQSCREFLPNCGHTCGNSCGICFTSAKHVCQARCANVLDCGHTCTAKCGEACASCKTFCSNCCEHQSCGAGERGFNRDCYELCALCTKTCSNRCVHRSCTKNCYEECNVKVCNEPCGEKLRCGHACLGMCGEICPKLCGTCERDKYVQCVASVSGTSPKVHRLIMNPKCHHVYPVEVLDAHVKEQKEANKQLTCIKCNAIISGVLRYTKYVKKRFIDENMKKMRAAAKNIDSEKVAFAATKMLNDADAKIAHLNLNQSHDVSIVLNKFQNSIRNLKVSISSLSGRAEYKWQLAFSAEVAHCFRAAAELLRSSCKYRLVRRKEIPPGVDIMINRLFAQHPFSKLISELGQMIDEFLKHWKSYMVGAVMPKMRLQLAKMTIIAQIIVMAYKLTKDGSDIKETQTKSVTLSCQRLFTSDERQQLTVNIVPIESVLLQIVPGLEKVDSFYSWEKLNIPKF